MTVLGVLCLISVPCIVVTKPWLSDNRVWYYTSAFLAGVLFQVGLALVIW